ncbi:MAG: hypothetical protein IJQ75_01780, partial [Synergistaceae bacterium]|nr:hypothetical protein [Synergistaceae bacterium]
MWFEFLLEGLKNFAGEIISFLLFIFVMWQFPLLRSLYEKYKKLKKNDNDTNIEQVLKDLEEQRKKEASKRAELELELEKKRHEEALRAQQAEEAKRRAEIERQLEAERQERERILAEAKLREEARKAEEAKRNAEIQRQLEAERKERERI